MNNAAYVYNEETGEIEMLSQVDSVDELQVKDIKKLTCDLIIDKYNPPIKS